MPGHPWRQCRIGTNTAMDWPTQARRWQAEHWSAICTTLRTRKRSPQRHENTSQHDGDWLDKLDTDPDMSLAVHSTGPGRA